MPIVIAMAKTYAGYTGGVDSSKLGLGVQNTLLGEKNRSLFSSKMDYRHAPRERAKRSKRSRRVEGDPRSIVGGRTFVAATSGTSRSVAGGQKRTGILGAGSERKGGWEEAEVCACIHRYMRQPHIG